MKKVVCSSIAIILLIALALIGCSSPSGSDDGITPPSLDGFYGTTDDGKTIEILISSSALNAAWSTGNYYVAKINDAIVSRGTIVASPGSISFTQTSGGTVSSINIIGSGAIIITDGGGTTYSGNVKAAEDYYYCIGATTSLTQSQIASNFTGKTPEDIYAWCSGPGSSYFDWPETREGTFADIVAFGKEYLAPDSVLSQVATDLNGRVSAWGYYYYSQSGQNCMFYVARTPL
jgi:hypothetical protein